MLQVGDLIKPLENSNLGAPRWFALTLMTERLHEDVEICSGFVFSDGAMNSNDWESGN